MHTAQELSSASFAVSVAGRPADLDAVLPGFTDRDRLGVVVRRPLGGAGASLLILAAVTGFYDVQRSRGEPFFIYPDYFVFHAGRTFGDHRRLDIWPAHKEVVVEPDAESLLRAVNDRGITRLVVEDGEPAADPELRRETLAGARRRIATCLAYGPDGRVRHGDVAIAGNEATERFVEQMLVQSGGAEAVQARRALVRDGRPVRRTARSRSTRRSPSFERSARCPDSPRRRHELRARRTRPPCRLDRGPPAHVDPRRGARCGRGSRTPRFLRRPPESAVRA